jgi:acyl-CoA synthetase (AMP-forming)/AMP-acid ligase II
MGTREGWIAGLEEWGDEREALCFEGLRMGYGALGIAARSTLDRLRVLGMETGDRVAILAPPSVEGVVLIHAMLAHGIVMFPLNLRLTEAEQRKAIETMRPRYLVIPRARKSEPFASAPRLVEGLGCGLIALG